MRRDPDNSSYLQEHDDPEPPVDVEALQREHTAALCRIEDLEAERDELLAVCKEALAKMEYALAIRVKMTGIATGGNADVIARMRDAIARAEGGAS